MPADDRFANQKTREHRIVFVVLLVGYASFYLCRANVDAALPLLHDAFGWDNAKLGTLSSIPIAVYAAGKILMGALGDRIGGRRLMLLAMCGSIASSLFFGISSGFWILVLAATLNRFFQSGGWVSLVQVVGRWFPPGRHGAVMGALSTSYELGNVGVLLLCGYIVKKGFGWRALFIVNPLLFGIAALMVFFMLRGEPPPDEASTEEEKKEAALPQMRFREAFAFLAKKPDFWATVVSSVLLTFVRTGFLTWSPTYLTEIARASGAGVGSVSTSIAKSAIFPATGIFAVLVVGRLTDRFGPGKRAPVLVVSLALHVVAVLVLAHSGIKDTTTAMIAIGACGIFLLGPYSLMAGALALDVAGKRAASTAAGIIDGAGYLGASFVGIVLGRVSQRWGWPAAFDVVAMAGFIATLVGVFEWMQKRSAEKRSAA
jgi:sugar phosphate permease